MTRREARRIVRGITTDPREANPVRNEFQIARDKLATRRIRLPRIRFTDTFIGLTALAAVVVFIVAIVALSPLGDSAQATGPGSTDQARAEAIRRCGGHAKTYDVQDQNLLVYACATDGKLKLLPYGN